MPDRDGSVALAERLPVGTDEPVALTAVAEAETALVEVPFARIVPVGDGLAGVTVVHFLSFPRPEQVTLGFLAVQTDALVVALHELEAALLAAGAAAASGR